MWDVTLVRGLQGARTGLIIRMHHCLADGIAGVGIMSALLDATPDAPRLPRKKLKFHVPPPRDALTSLTTGFVESYSDFVKRILSALTDLLTMTERAAANGNTVASDEFVGLLPEITAFTRAAPLQRDLPRTAEIRHRRDSSGGSQSRPPQDRNQHQRCRSHPGDRNHPPLL